MFYGLVVLFGTTLFLGVAGGLLSYFAEKKWQADLRLRQAYPTGGSMKHKWQ